METAALAISVVVTSGGQARENAKPLFCFTKAAAPLGVVAAADLLPPLQMNDGDPLSLSLLLRCGAFVASIHRMQSHFTRYPLPFTREILDAIQWRRKGWLACQQNKYCFYCFYCLYCLCCLLSQLSQRRR
jgi:hypothetical protein